MSLKVDIEKRKGGIFVIKLAGRLDTDTYQDFQEKVKIFLSATTKALILDMTGLEYISSVGLGVIFNIQKGIKANKGTFLMTNLQPQIQKVFDIVKTLPRQSIFKNMKEVDVYLGSMQKKIREEQK